MRFARLSSLLILLLAALLSGCGGNQIAAEEVPVDPPVLTIPSNPDAAPGATTADEDNASDDEDADADEDTDAAATADPASSGGAAASGGSTSSGSTGGTAPTAAPTAAPTEAPAEDTGGASADEGLDQFCADNPGAC